MAADYQLKQQKFKLMKIKLITCLLICISSIQGYSQTWDVLYLNGVQKLSAKKYKEAIADFTKAISIHPVPVIYESRAKAYELIGKIKEAIADYDTAITMDSVNWKTYCDRSILKIEVKDDSGALIDANRAIDISYKRPVPYSTRGRVYLATGAYNNALADFSKSVTLDSNYLIGYLYRAMTLRHLNKLSEALTDCDLLIQKGYEISNVYFVLGLLKSYSEDPEGALAAYQKADQIESGNPITINNIGWTFLDLNKPDSALKYFNKCLKLNSKHLDAIVGKGFTFYLKGNLESAWLYMDRIKNINAKITSSNDPVALLEGLGYFYQEKEKTNMNRMFSQYRALPKRQSK